MLGEAGFDVHISDFSQEAALAGPSNGAIQDQTRKAVQRSLPNLVMKRSLLKRPTRLEPHYGSTRGDLARRRSPRTIQTSRNSHHDGIPRGSLEITTVVY